MVCHCCLAAFWCLSFFILIQGCSSMKLSENGVTEIAIAEFDKHNGEGSHRKYSLTVKEGLEEWVVHFERLEIGLPGDNHVVFVGKEDMRAQYMSGE